MAAQKEPAAAGAAVQEITYLKKNVDHLRFAKRRLEEKVQDSY